MTLMVSALIGRRSKGLGATASVAVLSLSSEDTDVKASTALRSQPVDFIAVARMMRVGCLIMMSERAKN
jgi:hypothetical protein